mmetsp:Transcript_8596/g.12659  ORF Transcript_8596/g.12659 Transcript_8596/m.12659 type:complete len:206 (-) Transcript_8596:2519-3136(-)
MSSTSANKIDAFDPFGFSELDFDPFGDNASLCVGSSIHDDDASKKDPQQPSPPPAPPRKPVATTATPPTQPIQQLPPKIIVRVNIHEEVSTSIEAGEKVCRASIEGTIQAQVHSSNATKNAPFLLCFKEPSTNNTAFKFDGNFAAEVLSNFVDGQEEERRRETATLAKLTIPKGEIGTVKIADYTAQCEIKNLPFVSILPTCSCV